MAFIKRKINGIPIEVLDRKKVRWWIPTICSSGIIIAGLVIYF